MKVAQLYKAGDIRIEDVLRPGSPVDDEVLLQVEAAGICGSDLHNFHTGVWISRSPSIPGHEFCAKVIETGKSVKSLSVGDRVVADSRVPCGICDKCVAGKSYLCKEMGFVGEVNNGGFAPFTLQKENQLIRLPDANVLPEIAAMAEPLAVALHAVNRIGVGQGEKVVIVGAGTIGVMCVIALQHIGVKNISLADVNDQRREHVCNMFDLLPIDLATCEYEESDKPNCCIDTTGSSAVLSMLVQNASRGAKIAIVGLYRDELTIDMNPVVEGGLTLCGCAAFDNELYQAVDLLSVLSPELKKVSTALIDVEAIPTWYKKLGSSDTQVQKAIIVHHQP